MDENMKKESDKDQEYYYKLWRISGIMQSHLDKIRRDVGEEYGGNKTNFNDWLLGLDREKLEGLIEEYVDAQNSSNFIYIIQKDIIEDLKRNLPDILKKIPNEPLQKDSYIYLDSEKDYGDEFRIKINTINIDQIIPYWDFKNKLGKYHRMDRILPVPIRILFDKNLLIIRTSHDKTASMLKEWVLGEFSNKAKRLWFDNENLMKIFEYMAIVRSAHVGYEGESHLQNASYSAGKDSEGGFLNNLKLSEKFIKEIKEGTLRNCNFSIPKDGKIKERLKSEECVTIGINFLEGKIHFKTHLTEYETNKWIIDIIDNINIERIFTKKIDRRKFKKAK